MATTSTPTRRRRVRPQASKVTAKKRELTKSEQQLALIRDIMIRQQALAVELKAAEEDMEKLMLSGRLEKVSLEDIIAEIVTPAGRKTRTVRVRDSRRLVSEEDFINCASISITAAQEVLSGKELESVCDVTLPKKKPPELRVKMVKPSDKGKT